MIKRILWKIGRYLVQMNYTKGPGNAVEHDLRLQVQELKQQVSRLSIQNTILKTKLFMVKL